MKIKYPCIEKTLDIRHKNTVVRLWIDVTDGKKIDTNEIIDIVTAYLSKNNSEEEIIESIVDSIEHINAIQVISEDDSKNTRIGTVVYTVSFGDDVHG